MRPVLTRAAEALRKVAENSFEVEVSTGEVSGARAEGEEESTPREVGLLIVRRGSHRWDFRVLEVGRLTKERAAQLLSSTDLAVGPGPKEGSREAGKEASLLVSEHMTEEAGRLLRSKGACYLSTPRGTVTCGRARCSRLSVGRRRQKESPPSAQSGPSTRRD